MQQESSISKSLEERFLNPPISVKPYVWWHWMGSNFSKEGITKDLEAMRESGITADFQVEKAASPTDIRIAHRRSADFEWGKDHGQKMGRAMLAYPDWFVKNQPRPSQERKTFSIWYYYRSDSELKPAGLAGTVKLVFESEGEL